MEETTDYPENFFQTNEFLYKISGLWFYNPKEISKLRKYLQYLYTSFAFTTAMYFFILEFAILNETVKDVNQFFSHIGLLLSHTLGIPKCLVMVLQHHRLQKLINVLQDKKFQYESLGDFNPGKILSEGKKISHRFSTSLISIYGLVGVFAHLSSEVIINNEVKGKYFEGETTCYDYMPYYFHIPFSVNTKANCELALILMDYSLLVFALVIGCHDVLYAALLNCLKTQLVILKEAIRTIRPRVNRRLGLDNSFEIFQDESLLILEKEMYKEMTHLNKHLMALLWAADELENMFTYITLAQTLTSLFNFASCLFVAASLPVTSPQFFAQLEYFLCMLLQMGLFCWFGSGITRASEEIMLALYDCDWRSSSKRFKAALILTMCRLQRPIYLSIGKFYPLTLNAIISVLKASFSYYTVFRKSDE